MEAKLELKDEVLEELFRKAKEAADLAYAPYSNFKVGSVLLLRDERTGELIYVKGSNVENASYGLSICAERVAVFKAISEGYRPDDRYSWLLIAIYTPTYSFTPPCGACRQVLSEFKGDIPVVVFNRDGEYKVYNLRELLPLQFKLRGEAE